MTMKRKKMPWRLARECARYLIEETGCRSGRDSVWTMRTVRACCHPDWVVPLGADQNEWHPVTVENCARAYRDISRPRPDR